MKKLIVTIIIAVTAGCTFNPYRTVDSSNPPSPKQQNRDLPDIDHLIKSIERNEALERKISEIRRK